MSIKPTTSSSSPALPSVEIILEKRATAKMLSTPDDSSPALPSAKIIPEKRTTAKMLSTPNDSSPALPSAEIIPENKAAAKTDSTSKDPETSQREIQLVREKALFVKFWNSDQGFKPIKAIYDEYVQLKSDIDQANKTIDMTQGLIQKSSSQLQASQRTQLMDKYAPQKEPFIQRFQAIYKKEETMTANISSIFQKIFPLIESREAALLEFRHQQEENQVLKNLVENQLEELKNFQTLVFEKMPNKIADVRDQISLHTLKGFSHRLDPRHNKIPVLSPLAFRAWRYISEGISISSDYAAGFTGGIDSIVRNTGSRYGLPKQPTQQAASSHLSMPPASTSSDTSFNEDDGDFESVPSVTLPKTAEESSSKIPSSSAGLGEHSDTLINTNSQVSSASRSDLPKQSALQAASSSLSVPPTSTSSDTGFNEGDGDFELVFPITIPKVEGNNSRISSSSTDLRERSDTPTSTSSQVSSGSSRVSMTPVSSQSSFIKPNELEKLSPASSPKNLTGANTITQNGREPQESLASGNPKPVEQEVILEPNASRSSIDSGSPPVDQIMDDQNPSDNEEEVQPQQEEIQASTSSRTRRRRKKGKKKQSSPTSF